MIASVSDIKGEAREIIEQTMRELFTEGENKVMDREEAVKLLNQLCMKPRYPYIGRYWDPREDVFTPGEGEIIDLTANYFVEHSAFIWENPRQKKVS